MIFATNYPTWVEQIVHAEDAHRNPDTPLVALPIWSMRPSRVNIGRKGLAADGTVAPVAVRVHWDGPSVRSVGEPMEVEGCVSGLGWDERFTASIDAEGTVSGLPDGVHAAAPPRSRTAIVSGGTIARWEMGMSLERMIRSRISHMNIAVGAEIGAGGIGALDEVSLEKIVTEAHLGRDGEKGSVVQRAIDACLLPQTFQRVEITRYLSTRMNARVIEMVRDDLGDPRIGFKVRKVFREVQPSSLDELISAYQERYPKDHLGRGVAIAALGTNARLDVLAGALDENVATTRYDLSDDGSVVARTD